MHKRVFTAKRDVNLLRQRMHTASHFVYKGGMFSADKLMVAYVQTLENNSCVEDLNGNPILIEDATDFKDTVMGKHREVMNELYEEYQKYTT